MSKHEREVDFDVEPVMVETEERPEPVFIEGQTTLVPPDMKWEGAEALRQYLVPIEDLVDHERNPNRGDVFMISRSLEKYGQVRPILRDDMTIVAGHHVRAAARDLLGWTHIAAVPHEFATEEDRLAYLLVDNKVAKQAELDAEAELGIHMDLEAAGYEEVPGYDIDELETLRELAGHTPESEGREWEGEAGESPEAAAARAAAIAQYEQHREVVLLLDYPDQYDPFSKDVRLLMTEYKTTGTVATIVRAVAEAAAVVAARSVPSEELP